MKRKPVAIILALALAMCLGTAPAWAYFTWNDEAAGGTDVKFEPDTTIHEKYADGKKTVYITNDEDAGPAKVRVRVYASTVFDSVTTEGAKWEPSTTTVVPGDPVNGDSGWIEYTEIVEPGGQTSDLTVNIDFPTQTAATADEAYKFDKDANYNVVVVYEASPVVYDESGEHAYAVNWGAGGSGSSSN